jgi:predicted Zn finger-like uncharacterized protein
MIIICPNCNKLFKIDTSLIPVEGRNLRCGSCNHVWFYKIEDKKTQQIPLKEDLVDNEDESTIYDEKINEIIKTKQSSLDDRINIKDKKDLNNIPEKQILIKNETKKITTGKFFSYMVVLIISFVALIILVDTLKTPLVNIFPGLEIILFNLFEVLKDIKLFIIDLY